MVKCTCIYKFRDNQGNIKGYRLQDQHGVVQEISSDDLKNAIRHNQIHVDNLTLTSDNRLLSKTEREMTDGRLEYIARRRRASLGSKYQVLFEPFGIDVVTAVYLAYPKEGDDINSIYRRTFKKVVDIRELVVDPTPIVGIFDDEYTEIDQYKAKKKEEIQNINNDNNDKLLSGGEFRSQVILLVLHKNGGFRTVILSEITEATNMNLAGQYIIQNITGKDEDYKYLFSIITLNENKNPRVTKLRIRNFKELNDKNRKMIVDQILASTVDLWLGQDATKNILNKMNKKHLGAKLKRAGIATLGLPFTAVGLVGKLGLYLTCDFADEVSTMSLDEKAVLITEGYASAVAYKELKNHIKD